MDPRVRIYFSFFQIILTSASPISPMVSPSSNLLIPLSDVLPLGSLSYTLVPPSPLGPDSKGLRSLGRDSPSAEEKSARSAWPIVDRLAWVRANNDSVSWDSSLNQIKMVLTTVKMHNRLHH